MKLIFRPWNEQPFCRRNFISGFTPGKEYEGEISKDCDGDYWVNVDDDNGHLRHLFLQRFAIADPALQLPLHSFTIEREKWLTPDKCEDGQSILHRSSDGLECCLGQVGRQCGIPIARLKYLSPYGQVAEHKQDETKWPEVLRPVSDYRFGKNNSSLARECMHINDDPNIPNKTREVKLIAKFASVGINIQFV